VRGGAFFGNLRLLREGRNTGADYVGALGLGYALDDFRGC
jgi:hypothetical protein